jgi:predicted permease
MNRLKASPLVFGQGTLACATAHNLNDLGRIVNLDVLAEASKTGLVAAVFFIVAIVGGTVAGVLEA